MKIIFDLDDTLYKKPEKTKKREEAILEFFGDKKEDFLELHKKFGTIGSFVELGEERGQFFRLMDKVPINLEKDEILIKILNNLKKNHTLIVLSNNSISCIKTSLEQLGILELIDEMYSTEDFANSKPAEECFCMVDKGDICVGNSFRKDLMIPKQKGATTIFVGGEHPEADFNIQKIHELEKLSLN